MWKFWEYNVQTASLSNPNTNHSWTCCHLDMHRHFARHQRNSWSNMRSTPSLVSCRLGSCGHRWGYGDAHHLSGHGRSFQAQQQACRGLGGVSNAPCVNVFFKLNRFDWLQLQYLIADLNWFSLFWPQLMFLPSFVTPTPGGLTSPRTEIMHFTVVADLGEMSGWAAVESMVYQGEQWPSVGSSDFVADFLWFLWGWRSFNNLKGIMKQLGRHSDTAFFVIFVTCGILWPYLWQLKVPRHPRYKVCVRTLEDNFPELVKRIVLTSAPHAWVSRGLDLEHGWWQIPFKSTILEYIRPW